MECATVVRGKLCTILKCCLWVYYVVRLCMLGGMDRWVSGGGGWGSIGEAHGGGANLKCAMQGPMIFMLGANDRRVSGGGPMVPTGTSAYCDVVHSHAQHTTLIRAECHLLATSCA